MAKPDQIYDLAKFTEPGMYRFGRGLFVIAINSDFADAASVVNILRQHTLANGAHTGLFRNAVSGLYRR